MMMYKHWEAQVNGLMLKKHGVGVDDIADMPYRDWWKNCYTPEAAVAEAIQRVNDGEFL